MNITTTHRRLLVGLAIAGASLATAIPATAMATASAPTTATPHHHVVDEGGPPHRVRFARGTDHGTVSGAIGDGVSDRFVLRAGAGQRLTVAGLGALHLSVVAPDGSPLPGGPGDTITFDLPLTGDYVVEVLPGMGEATAYRLTLTIPATTSEAGATRVIFPAGTFGTVIHGHVDGGDLNRYVLRAASGQTMTVSLGSDRDAARFSLLAPDGAVIVGEQASGVATLPATGDYTLAVWSLAGNPDYDLTVDIR